MSAAAVFAILMLLFFLAGVAVGVVVVAAASARRAEKVKAPRRSGPRVPRGWPHDPDTGSGDDRPDRPSRWRSRNS
jgi:hypothetical protein